MEKNKLDQIKNPLVLIAVFAGIAEVSMAITIVQLPETIQKTFIWFVMAFPILLIFGFFFILYKKPAVLFSPSDYQKDEMYLSSISENQDTAGNIKRLDQFEESLNVLQQFVKTIDINNGGSANFTEAWRQLESLHQMESNGLYAFLKDELNLSSQQISSVISDASSPKELASEILKISGNLWKAERMAGVLKVFPTVYSDYDILKKVVEPGDNS